jgi:hypothetical protein
MPSPRLKSPTPSVKSRHNSSGSTAKPMLELPENNAVVERPVTEAAEGLARLTPVTSSSTAAGSKIPRGYSGRMLETVEEGDQPLSPHEETISSAASSIIDGEPMILREHTTDSSNMDTSDAISITSHEGGEQVHRSDFADRTSSIKKSDTRRDSSSTVKKAYSVLVPTKIRGSNDTSAKNMTVETETVASIPTTIIASAADRTTGRGDSGTLRKMSSVETIKPRKKRTMKKPPSMISGTTSSKADIFEAKVANAVDEDQSDSDETFVYESNPPEPRHRQHRHHSRTPSNTSLSSFRDRRSSARPAGNLLDNHRKLRGKRSMKFVSQSYAGSQDEELSGEADQGTVRASNSKRSGGSAFLAHDLYGPNNDNDAPNLQESPYSQAARLRNQQNVNSRHSSKGDTQLVPSPMYLNSPTRKGTYSPYEYNNDNERTPLVGSVRGQRVRPYRRQPNNGSIRHLDYYSDDHDQRGCVSRSAGCAVITVIVMLVIMGAVAFLFATSKPLYDLQVYQIQNVVASEQEIMLSLLVEAFNPNIVGITVSEMDVNVFARSRYADSGVLDNVTANSKLHARRLAATGSHDHGTDPMPSMPDPSSDPQTMLLGRVFDFDSALMFDGSPLRRLAHNSTGEFRLPWPGNNTELGGHEKWERVLKHRFELIVRGILKYQLPLSSRTMTVGISANVTVNGEIVEVDDRDIGAVLW